MSELVATSNFVSLQKVELQNLEPFMSNVLIVGIIIAKSRPKIFECQPTEANLHSNYRAVWNFTIRDSLQHYINVSYWGTPETIFQANDKFATGNVVEVVNPQIGLRQSQDRSELFQPMVTSPYKLTLGDKSAITPHQNPDPYQHLLHIPTKPTAMFVPLNDIHTRGASIEFADVLGALKGLKEIRSVKSRTSDVMMQVRQIEVFDRTSLNLKVTLWEPDIINRSNFWTPKSTVLFMTDLNISWSEFDCSFVGKTSSRTVVTVDPATREGKELYEFAQGATVETYDIVEQLIAAMPTSTATDEVLNIRQLHDRVNNCCENIQAANKSFIAVIFGIVTELDLDGLSDTLSVKCGHCKTRIKGFKCENAECPVVFDNLSVEPEVTFDIRVSISDHSGTLVNCRLRGNSAEQALGCSAKDFSALTDDEKGNLKWKYLLEQCKVRIAIVFVAGENPVFSILQIETADPHEMAIKIPVY